MKGCVSLPAMPIAERQRYCDDGTAPMMALLAPFWIPRAAGVVGAERHMLPGAGLHDR